MFRQICWAISRGLMWATCIFVILGLLISALLGIGFAFVYSIPAGIGAIFLALAVVIAACKYDEY